MNFNKLKVILREKKVLMLDILFYCIYFWVIRNSQPEPDEKLRARGERGDHKYPGAGV